MPYFVKENSLYFSHRDLTWGLAFTFFRNLNIHSEVEIIVLDIYCPNKSILARNSWTHREVMPKKHHLIFKNNYLIYILLFYSPYSKKKKNVEVSFSLIFINWFSFKFSIFMHIWNMYTLYTYLQCFNEMFPRLVIKN